MTLKQLHCFSSALIASAKYLLFGALKCLTTKLTVWDFKAASNFAANQFSVLMYVFQMNSFQAKAYGGSKFAAQLGISDFVGFLHHL